MKQTVEEVPNVLTSKDLDYLSDMFQWNYGAFKKISNSAKNIQNEAIKLQLEEAATCFQNNLKQILTILGGHNGTNQ